MQAGMLAGRQRLLCVPGTHEPPHRIIAPEPVNGKGEGPSLSAQMPDLAACLPACLPACQPAWLCPLTSPARSVHAVMFIVAVAGVAVNVLMMLVLG